jgi:integrase
MSSLTSDVITRYAVERQQAGAANATINRELSIIKRAFELAVRSRKLSQDHVPHIEMLEENNVRQGFFERAQFEAIRNHLPIELRPLVTLMYYTGWRMGSELLPLQWHQVDRTAGIIRLEPGTTKNDEARTMPYGQVAELREAIDTQWQAREALAKKGVICPWVFHRKGKPIKDCRGAWNAAAAKAGCPGRIPHDSRRTAVRNLTRAGVTETVAMKITGHKTRSVFDRYNITSEADLTDAARKLDRLTGTISGTVTPNAGNQPASQSA